VQYRRVPAAELRKVFRDSGIEKQVLEGKLLHRVEANGHPSPPLADEPICTRSQIVVYFDANKQKVCKIHRYLRKDGTLGASGLPDPKLVRVSDDLTYLLRESDP
jgi:hypothetical protein